MLSNDEKDMNVVGEPQAMLTNVRFYKRTMPNIVKGEEVGLEERDFVEIANPGDSTVVIDVEATPEYRDRYPARWKAYKELSELDGGTDVMEWDGIPENMRREFKARGFNFIEQIALAGDNAFFGIPGGISWRERAMNYLGKAAKKSKDSEMEEMKRQLAETQAMLAELMLKKAGRPLKE